MRLFGYMCLYAAMTMNAPAQTNPANNAKSNGDHVSRIQSLTENVGRLKRSLEHWNTGYVVCMAATVLAALGIFVTQRAAIKKGIEVAEAQREISELQGQDFQVDLKEKERDIAGLKKVAESERLERMRLEAVVAPRSLTLDQQQKISVLLKRFSGKTVLVESHGMDTEGTLLATQIIAILHAAKISVVDHRAYSVVTGPIATGVGIRGPASEDTLVSTLGEVLRHIGGLEVTVNGAATTSSGGMIASGGMIISGSILMGGGGQVTIPAGPSPPGSPVYIMVGTKPLPMMPNKE
jgi:hypothetical protein